MSGHRPFSELTKDFSPERLRRISGNQQGAPEHQMTDKDVELEPEGELIVKTTKAITNLMATGMPFPNSMFILDAPTPEGLPMMDVAVNHCFITILHQLAWEAREQSPSDDPQLRGATMLTHMMTIRAISLWANGHPEEAAAVEAELQRVSNLHQLSEDDFNSRTQQENCQAVRAALNEPHQLPPSIHHLDPLVSTSLHAIREAAAAGLRRAEGDNQPSKYIYFHDTHFDHWTTCRWADLLIQTKPAA